MILNFSAAYTGKKLRELDKAGLVFKYVQSSNQSNTLGAAWEDFHNIAAQASGLRGETGSRNKSSIGATNILRRQNLVRLSSITPLLTRIKRA